MLGEEHQGRTIVAITGDDRVDFLQGLVTNDVTKARDSLIYAGLLSPQGKYLADFFLLSTETGLLLDVSTSQAADLIKRLRMYMLRAKVALEETSLSVHRGLGPTPDGAFADPRLPDLGWRMYTNDPGAAGVIDWDAIRVAHCIPETGIELRPNETFILEAGFERLSGVDFRKGCYVGQEVTARMKHKTTLRKGLAQVVVAGPAPNPGTEILADGKAAGHIYTVAGGLGIAHLRFDRAGEGMQAGSAEVGWAP